MAGGERKRVLNSSTLAGFTGTECWHQWSSLFPNMVLTDGAKYVAEVGNAYWIMDAIASYQLEFKRNSRLQQFQLWTLKVNELDRSATLICQEDSDVDPVVEQHIGYTDFEMSELRLYCMSAGDGKSKVILLPSEY